MKNVTIKEIYLEMATIAAPLFEGKTYPWEILPEIGDFIKKTGPELPEDKFDNPSEGIWIAKSAKVAPTAMITAPCIIDEEAEIRHCAFIRGNAIIGKGTVVGNSCELKNSILFDKVQTPHYNYVGDSILGYRSHMGAGSITSNVKSDKKNVIVKGPDGQIETGRKKVGGMLGDFVEIGCGSILNPGSVIGPHTHVYPLSSVRGVVPPHSIYKCASEIAEMIEG